MLTSVPTSVWNPFPPNDLTIRTLLELASSPALEQIVEAVDPDASFVVVTNELRDAPILTIDVSAATAELASRVYEAITEQLDNELVRVQDQEQVAENVRTELRVLLPASEPTVTPSSVVRPLAGVVILGAALSVGAAILVETLLTRRRRRSNAQTSHEASWSLTAPQARVAARRGH